MTNAIATTAAAAGLVAFTMQNVMPVVTGPQLSKFFIQSPATFANSETLQAKFDRLANGWRRNTGFSSSVDEIVLDPNYQQIIGMGTAALPLILSELKDVPEHWFWALAAITGDNPAANEPDGDIQAAANAWVSWGKIRSIIR